MSVKYIAELPHFVVNVDYKYMKSRREMDANAFDKMCNRFKERFDDNASA